MRAILGLTLLLVCCGGGVLGHIILSYPPPTLRIDFLDNLRSGGICGHAPSGRDRSDYWKLPEPSEDTTTDLEARSKVSVAWDLHYAHQGGFQFELYDSDLNMVSVWNDTDHWDCSYDGTQQTIDITMPSKPCEKCILRLQRQALEWGRGYRFHSCAQVNIVEEAEDSSDCNGCSGHGTCRRGKCECDSSQRKGFWYGKYCERQNECEEDSHCGEEGKCIDTEAMTAPRKQCYCNKGFFGDEKTRGESIADFISTRDCSRKSKLTLGDPEDWETEYDQKLQAGETMTVYYKIDERKQEIEFAITAKTTSWVGFGFRAARARGVERKKGDKDYEGSHGEGESELASEGEADGNRRLLSTMPGLEAEVLEHQRSLLQDGNKKKKSGRSESESEGETQSESEVGSEGEGAAAFTCPDDSETVTAKSDEGNHFRRPVKTKVSLGGSHYAHRDGESDAESETDTAEEAETRGRKLASVPELEAQLVDSVVPAGRHLLDRSHDHSDDESEGESEAHHGHKKAAKSVYAEGTACENTLVDAPGAHAMINQDIIIAYVKGGRIRVQDTFTPNRARPTPDIFFGGEDDIVDAVGEETADGFTNVKVRRKLQTTGSGDYCILEDVSYLAIYAIGQGDTPFHDPDSSLEAGHASNEEFYRDDELKYHGGGIKNGIGVAFPGRGSFGLVNFFGKVVEEGTCTESNKEGFTCMENHLAGEVQLHWKVEDDEVTFGLQTPGTGWAAVAFPETPGVMVGADAVMGWIDGDTQEIGVFKLEARSPAGIIAGNNAFDISEGSVESTSEGTFLMFSRKFDDSFESDTIVDILLAYHPETAIGFPSHGSTNRGDATVDLSAAPDGDSSNSGVSVRSTSLFTIVCAISVALAAMAF